MKREKIRENFKSVLLGALLVALVCLCVVYIISFSGSNPYEFTKQDMEKVSQVFLRTEYLSHWDVSFASPAFIGFSSKKDGENIGFYTLGGENAEVYETVFPFYEKLFGKNGYVESMDIKEGEAQFLSLLQGDYIYLSYACDLPISVIVSMANENAVYEGAFDAYIREILIVPNEYLGKTSVSEDGIGQTELYSFYAIARDSAGNYYRCSSDFIFGMDESVFFHTNYYSSYTKAENCLPYEFACVWEAEEFFTENKFLKKVKDTSVIPLAEMDCPTVFSDTYTHSEKEINALLEIFSLNPEKASSYQYENGNIFYFDKGKHLCFQPDGVMVYNLYGTEPLPLENIFHRSLTKEDYSTTDYLVASFLLLNSFADAQPNLECDFYLSGIYYDGETLKLCFGYSVFGLPVYFEGQTDMIEFVFSSGALQSAKYCFRVVEKSAQTDSAQDFIWALRSLILINGDKRRYFYGYYISEKQSYFNVLVLEEIQQ